MFSPKIYFVLAIGFIVAANCAHYRFARSPETVEMNSGNYTTDTPANQENMNDEEDYWHQHGDKYEEQYEQNQGNKNPNTEQSQQQFDEEKNYREQQEKEKNNEQQENMNSNKDKIESDQQDTEDHYNEHHGDNGIEDEPNHRNDELNEEYGSKEDRYEGKGKEEMENRDENIQSMDPQGDGPSVNYS